MEDAESATNAAATGHERHLTPAARIEGKVTGALQRKFRVWAADFGDVMSDLGYNDWDEFRSYKYERMELARHTAALLQDINGAIHAQKKVRSEVLMGSMQAEQLALVVRDIARDHAGVAQPEQAPPSPGGTSAYSLKSESQMNRDTAKLVSYSALKHDERLQLANGPGKAAHPSDVRTFVDDISKMFAGMEGFDALLEQLLLLANEPTTTLTAFRNNGAIPDDLWRQMARFCYTGAPNQYRKDVLSQSQHAERLFDPGVMAYALYEVSRDISDLEATRRKYEYLQPVAARPADTAMLVRAYKKFERDSFELFQLGELQTAKTDAPTIQYRVGCTIFSNFGDIANTWSKSWRATEPHTMVQMRQMMAEISDEIRKLPENQPQKYPRYPPGPGMSPKPTPNTEDKNMCREFQRQGHCRWGDACKFSHSQAKVMLAEMDREDEQVTRIQNTMMDAWNITESQLEDGERNFTSKEFKLAYDTAYATVGTEEYENTYGELSMMVVAEQDDVRRSVDGWHL